MSSNPALPPITCPSSLVASCAPLVGFTPSESLVALIRGVPGRQAPVALRVDLPVPGDELDWAARVAAAILGTRGCAVDAVAWSSCPDHSQRADLPTVRTVAALRDALDDVGVEATELLTTNGTMWWSHSCGDPGCCPPGPCPVDPVVMTAVRAEYAYAGRAPLRSREEIARRLAAHPQARRSVGRAWDRMASPADPEAWRDRELRWLDGLLRVGHRSTGAATWLDAGRAARVNRDLWDIAIRDTLVRRLVVTSHPCQECAEHRLEVLCQAVRMAPGGRGAPVATVLALVAWTLGEGALGSLALQRAHEEDPDYRLAQLAARLIARGSDPRDWCESLRGLSEEQCRAAARPSRAMDGAAGRGTSAPTGTDVAAGPIPAVGDPVDGL